MTYTHYFGGAGAGVKIEKLAEGTLTADGTVQTVLEIGEQEKPTRIYGWISLNNMDTGDKTVIRTYVKIKSGGVYIKHADELFEDAQARPAAFFVDRVILYGYKITLEQQAGTYRDYDYLFFKEVSA